MITFYITRRYYYFDSTFSPFRFVYSFKLETISNDVVKQLTMSKQMSDHGFKIKADYDDDDKCLKIGIPVVELDLLFFIGILFYNILKIDL